MLHYVARVKIEMDKSYFLCICVVKNPDIIITFVKVNRLRVLLYYVENSIGESLSMRIYLLPFYYRFLE